MSARPYHPLAQVRAVGGPYVDQVVADFRALPPEIAQAPRYAEARALADASGDLDWQQLFTLELWVLQLMPMSQLEARADILDQLFPHAATPRPKQGQGDYAERLRGWAVSLQSERQWAFRKNLLREQEGWRLRRRLNETLAAVTALALLVAWGGGLLGSLPIATLAGVGWLGVAGAYASVSRRIQAAGATRNGERPGTSALGDLCALDVGQDSVVQGMLLGGLFAVVGQCLLASGLLQQLFSQAVNGTLLPQFGAAPDPDSYLLWLLPAKAADCARLAVWSFLFGFAERLVPDVLDKLSGRLSTMQTKKESGRKGG